MNNLPDDRKIKSVKLDGEEVTYEDASQQIEREKWEMKKRSAKRSPFSKLSICRISTQGAER